MKPNPLATLFIIFYNQERFVEAAIDGAFSQTYDNLEIIFSDDYSTDNTFGIIQKKVASYKGPHKIIVNKNKTNMGLVPHVNKILFEIANGEYLFINGGDDISLPNRVYDGIEYFKKYPQIGAVTFSSIIINELDIEIGEKKEKKEKILFINDESYVKKSTFMTGGGALSISRQVLNVFGMMNMNCQTEDSVLRFRSLLYGGILSSPKFGLKYRIHNNNISKRFSNFKTDLIANQYERDLQLAKETITHDLYFKLNKKIIFYRKYRKLQEEMENKKRMIYLFYKFYLKLYKFVYSSTCTIRSYVGI